MSFVDEPIRKRILSDTNQGETLYYRLQPYRSVADFRIGPESEIMDPGCITVTDLVYELIGTKRTPGKTYFVYEYRGVR